MGTTPQLLPSGPLSTSGNQIVDQNGNPVKIACIGWSGGNVRNGVPDGLGSASYTALLDQVKAIGFNCIRLLFCDAAVINNDYPNAGVINTTLNPSMASQSCLQVNDQIITYCGTIGLRVIIDSHNNEGSNNQNYGANQPNGLWYDVGGASDGTDGGGNTGTVTDAKFLSNWQAIATRYKTYGAIVGYDLRNEPNSGNGVSGCTWGNGDVNHDICAMYQRVGNAILAIDSRPLIICEGVQNYQGTFASGLQSDGIDYGGGSNWIGGSGDLSGVRLHPVTLSVANKVVYSVHEYPQETSGSATDVSGSAKVTQMNAVWGFLVKNNTAPVWIGEMGSYFNGTTAQAAASTAWMNMMIQYMNGTATSGPTFNGAQQGIGMDWWVLGVDYSNNSVPDFGILTAWSGGSVRQNQYALYSQLFYTGAQGVTAATTDASGNSWTLDANGSLLRNGALLPDGSEFSSLTAVNGVIWATDSNTGIWFAYVNGVFVSQSTVQPSQGVTTVPSGTRRYDQQPGGQNSHWNKPLGTKAKWGSDTDADTVSARHGGIVNSVYSNLGSAMWLSTSAADPLIPFAGKVGNYNQPGQYGGQGTPVSITAQAPKGSYVPGPYGTYQADGTPNYDWGDCQYNLFDKTNHPGRLFEMGFQSGNGHPPTPSAPIGTVSSYSGIGYVTTEDATSDEFGEDYSTGIGVGAQGAGLITGFDLDGTQNAARLPGSTTLTRINHKLRYMHDPLYMKSGTVANSDGTNGNGFLISSSTLNSLGFPSNSWPQLYQDYQDPVNSSANYNRGNLVYGTLLGIPYSKVIPTNNPDTGAPWTNAGLQVIDCLKNFGSTQRDAAGGGYHLSVDSNSVPASWTSDLQKDLGAITKMLCPLRNERLGDLDEAISPKSAPGRRLSPWPPPLATVSPTPAFVQSPNFTVVIGSTGGTITSFYSDNDKGHTWSINAAGQVLVDGTADTTTSGAVKLAYVRRQIWVLNTAGNWYVTTYPNSGWTQGSNPIPATRTPYSALTGKLMFTESANFTTVPPAASIVDSSGVTWAISAGGLVTCNGNPDYTTANVTALAYVGGIVWQENTAGLWYSKSAPLAPYEPGPNPLVAPPPQPLSTGILNIINGIQPWAASHPTLLGDRCSNNGIAYQCVAPGTTAASGGPTGSSGNILDGTARWKWLATMDFVDRSGAVGALPSTFSSNITWHFWNVAPQTTAAATPFLNLSGHAMPGFTLILRAPPSESLRTALASQSLPLQLSTSRGTTFLQPLAAAAAVNYIVIADPSVIIDGLGFIDPQSNSGSTILQATGANTSLTVRNCILDGATQPGGAVMVQCDTTGPVLFTNCLIVDRQAAGGTDPTVWLLSNVTSARFVNCTFISINGVGGGPVLAAIPTVLRNCAVFGYSAANANNNCTFDHCVTDQATWGLGTNGGGNLFNQAAAATFINPQTDFRPLASSPLLNAGVTDLADIPAGDDIAMTLRTQGPGWDVGCWERVSFAVHETRAPPIKFW